MSELLIFGGTTEGRRLAEYCAEKGVAVDVSVVTDYGASLLPENIGALSGRLGVSEMTGLIVQNAYRAVIDATHPYAEEATCNIRAACRAAKVEYYRLLRDKAEVYGETADNISQMIAMLNECDRTVLSALGSSYAAELTAVRGFRERIWLRVLPMDGMEEYYTGLGYDESKIIYEKGPFTAEQNIAHIKKSGAEILLTKESGKAGGYVEKAEAARECGVRLITLVRPEEEGYGFEEIVRLIEERAF